MTFKLKGVSESEYTSLVASHDSIDLSFQFDPNSGLGDIQQLPIALSIPAANQLAHSIEEAVEKYLNWVPDSE